MQCYLVYRSHVADKRESSSLINCLNPVAKVNALVVAKVCNLTLVLDTFVALFVAIATRVSNHSIRRNADAR